MATPHNSSDKLFKKIVSNSFVQFVFLVATLITSIASNEPWVRFPALFVFFVILWVLRPMFWPPIHKFFIWLTWKFALGVTIGIIGVLLAAPILEPWYSYAVSFAVSQVEVLDSNPPNGGSLPVYGSVIVHFSQQVSMQYHQALFVKVEITPDIPITLTWIYNFDPVHCCRTLEIGPNKYFPNVDGPRFDANTTYHIRISGALIKNATDITVSTGP